MEQNLGENDGDKKKKKKSFRFLNPAFQLLKCINALLWIFLNGLNLDSLMALGLQKARNGPGSGPNIFVFVFVFFLIKDTPVENQLFHSDCVFTFTRRWVPEVLVLSACLILGCCNRDFSVLFLPERFHHILACLSSHQRAGSCVYARVSACVRGGEGLMGLMKERCAPGGCSISFRLSAAAAELHRDATPATFPPSAVKHPLRLL